MYDYYSDGKSSSENDAIDWQEDDNTIDGKMRKLAKEKGYKLEDTEDESKKDPKEDDGDDDSARELRFDGPKAKELLAKDASKTSINRRPNSKNNSKMNSRHSR